MRALVLVLTVFCACTSLQASLLEWDRIEATVEMEPGQEEAQASFTMTNTGDTPVRIDRVETSCGCTGSFVERKLVEPGESTEIIATFHRGKRRGGINTNRLEVFLDGHPRPVANLRFVAHIPVLVDLQPQVIYWNRGSSQTPRAVRMKLDTRYVQEIESVDYDASVFEVREETDPADASVRILRVQPLDFGQALRGDITITAKGAEGFRETARIYALVQP